MIVAISVIMALPSFAEKVMPETARKVATTFLNNNGAKSAQLTDLSKAAGFANLYIFTTENSFVVMAADDCVQPILGYSLTGKFVVEGMPENVRCWLQGYSNEIQSAINSNAKATFETAKQWKDMIDGNTKAGKATPIVEALVQTTWNQDAPYNSLCPIIGSTRTVTGCVATAMAQVMKFWNHPTMGTGTNSYSWNSQALSADFGATTYDWDNMTNTYGSSSTQAQKDAVATLMYHCGVSVNMDYNISGSGGSSASTYNVMDALQNYFSYAPSMKYKSKDDYGDELWIAMLKKELNDGRPMQYRGSDAGGNGGHSFVCDGYDSDDYFHFNWGWGSYCDGYYSVNDMEPGVGGIGAGNGVYTVDQSAIFGIEPISALEAPILSVAAAERCINLTWNAISEATSYDVYKDNVKVATSITENTYTDTDIVSGNYYEYYVRAVNNETRSNPSNTVIEMLVFRDIAPSNLSAAMDGENITLSWTGYEGNQSIELHYAVSSNNYAWAADEEVPGSYWGQRYPSSMLSNLFGMEIDKVSCCFYFASNYTMYVFNGVPTETDKLCERSYTKTTNSLEWFDFAFDTPIHFDCSKDLWIVFYNNDSEVQYPALIGDYDGMGASDAKYIATTLEDLPTSSLEEDYSFLIRTCFSDGTYTYNIYDGETKLNEEVVIGTSYTHESPTSNTIHRYTVKTNWSDGESTASNLASVAIGKTVLESLSIGSNDRMTVAENSTLTVTGTLSNDNPANLILENGAQLIHNSTGVKATVKKTIVPYSADDNGWNFIASPVAENVTPSEDNGLIANQYDLYYYNEPAHHWRNYRLSTFDLAYKQGYLYANGTETALQFEGTLAPNNSPLSTDNLSYSAETLKGFNLVGNPFACNATIDQDCYVINGRRVILADIAPTLAPCEGVMVKADSDEYTVTFTKANAAKSSGKNKSLDLVVTRGGVSAGSTPAILDRARVRIGEGMNMEKFTLDNAESTQLSFWQDGQEYAVAYIGTDGVHTVSTNEIPLNFKAAENGTYSIGIETNGLDLDYLHLIDNMTGADVDLLATNGGDAMPCVSTYTFEAKTTDYASRFRLVFNANDASTGSASFAYVSNGEIVITADASDASLQVVDVMGRVIASFGGHTRCVPTSGMPIGIYVLRLIDDDKVMTQKIVIE